MQVESHRKNIHCFLLIQIIKYKKTWENPEEVTPRRGLTILRITHKHMQYIS